MASKVESTLPTSFALGQDLNWGAAWIDVNLWVELPFWLMVNDTKLTVEQEGHSFPVTLHEAYFECYGGALTDSRNTAFYRGPLKPFDKMSIDIQKIRQDNPNAPFMWRKCKTVVKIATRSNIEAWEAAISEEPRRSSITQYLIELCRAHIPVINKLVQGYRLATYDYFAFEVSPWDVPRWLVERDNKGASALLVPYRGWDVKPSIFEAPDRAPVPYQLIKADDLNLKSAESASRGELELLDALNFMERGDYSGAVRRITTAIEVMVEAALSHEINAAEGEQAATKFLKDTQTRFDRRVTKYEELTKRKLSEGSRKSLGETRKLRHRIVHGGYRITSGERGRAQRSIDTGRWIYNWFENDPVRRKIREQRPAFRSLGRDLIYGVFRSRITPDGVVVSPAADAE